MKIVFFDIMPGEQEALSALLPSGHIVEYRQEALTEDTASLADGADIVSVFIKSELKRQLLDHLTHLQLIVTRSMGFDHIDTAYAKTHNIKTINVTTYASHPVAEFTFALLLNVTRRVNPAYNQLREGTNFDLRSLKGVNLFGKTIGVAGTGRIGKNVVSIAKGFGMKVLVFDANPDLAFAQMQGCSYVSLEELTSQSDIISLHLPHTPETHHIINAEMFSRMKKGVILINTARGEIVETHALVAALQNGTVSAAGLDVLEAERQLHTEITEIASANLDTDYRLLTANHILIDMPNVIVTPHIAFETTEAMDEICRSTAASIQNFIAGTEQHYL